jgi:hypothetical protein
VELIKAAMFVSVWFTTSSSTIITLWYDMMPKMGILSCHIFILIYI